MPTKVNLPDGRVVNFPDGMAPADIENALGEIHGNASPPHPLRARGWQPVSTLTSDDTPPATDWKSNLAGAMEPMAHPQTLGDFGNLILAPVDATRGIGTKLIGQGLSAIAPKVGPAVSATGRGVEKIGATLDRPSRYVGAWEMLTNPIKGAAVMATPPIVKAAGRGLQRVGQMMAPVVEEAATVAPEVTAPSLAPAVDASLEAQLHAHGLDPSRMVSHAPAPGAKPTQFSGPLRPIERPPMTVSPESPLQEPRVGLGAEDVGRQNGLTKQQVRDVTGPIHGEAQGEASPVFPEKPFERMHDTLRALPKEGPDRQSYVEAARDLKARQQLTTILRTLQRNGLALGGLSAAGTARDQLLKLLDTSSPDPQ